MLQTYGNGFNGARAYAMMQECKMANRTLKSTKVRCTQLKVLQNNASTRRHASTSGTQISCMEHGLKKGDTVKITNAACNEKYQPKKWKDIIGKSYTVVRADKSNFIIDFDCAGYVSLGPGHLTLNYREGEGWWYRTATPPVVLDDCAKAMPEEANGKNIVDELILDDSNTGRILYAFLDAVDTYAKEHADAQHREKIRNEQENKHPAILQYEADVAREFSLDKFGEGTMERTLSKLNFLWAPYLMPKPAYEMDEKAAMAWCFLFKRVNAYAESWRNENEVSFKNFDGMLLLDPYRNCQYRPRDRYPFIRGGMAQPYITPPPKHYTPDETPIQARCGVHSLNPQEQDSAEVYYSEPHALMGYEDRWLDNTWKYDLTDGEEIDVNMSTGPWGWLRNLGSKRISLDERAIYANLQNEFGVSLKKYHNISYFESNSEKHYGDVAKLQDMTTAPQIERCGLVIEERILNGNKDWEIVLRPALDYYLQNADSILSASIQRAKKIEGEIEERRLPPTTSMWERPTFLLGMCEYEAKFAALFSLFTIYCQRKSHFNLNDTIPKMYIPSMYNTRDGDHWKSLSSEWIQDQIDEDVDELEDPADIKARHTLYRLNWLYRQLKDSSEISDGLNFKPEWQFVEQEYKELKQYAVALHSGIQSLKLRPDLVPRWKSVTAAPFVDRCV